jgi:hypothetical protein
MYETMRRENKMDKARITKSQPDTGIRSLPKTNPDPFPNPSIPKILVQPSIYSMDAVPHLIVSR